MGDTIRISTGRLALLVDGDNVSPQIAQQITAGLRGRMRAIRRIYGNAAQAKGWDAQPGFRLIHSGTGKNATDLLLCIDALDLFNRGRLDTPVLVSSDGDFSHLVHHLRECGVQVIGMGEAKTPQAMRAACDQFVDLHLPHTPATAKPTTATADPAPPKAPPSGGAIKPVATPVRKLSQRNAGRRDPRQRQ